MIIPIEVKGFNLQKSFGDVFKRASKQNSSGQLSQFERGRIIGMVEAGWSAKRVSRQLCRTNCVVRRCWDNGSQRCHLYEDQAQDTLDRPVIEKTATS
ncbi:UNVERIFIED_CONTAM: hypothetical protein NCL1_28901 [Trichonephila clavipes]